MKKRLVLLFGLGFLLIVSCQDSKSKSYAEGYENAQNKAQIAEEEKIQNAPVLYVFDGGTITVNDKNLLRKADDYEEEVVELADAFYLIKHPRGILLWDTGLPERLVGKEPVSTADGAFTLSRKDSITTQLASVGVAPDDVDFIGLSHVHFDHTGGANHFKNATWLVPQSTLDLIESDSLEENPYYDPKSFENLSKSKALTEDYDVFGDGKVVIKHFPGHEEGHQALFLNLAESDPIVLSGDVYHFKEYGLQGDSPRSTIDLTKFEEFVKNKHAKIYIQHDLEDFEAMPKVIK